MSAYDTEHIIAGHSNVIMTKEGLHLWIVPPKKCFQCVFEPSNPKLRAKIDLSRAHILSGWGG